MESCQISKDESLNQKAIFKDMLKYSPSKICGMIGNAIIIPIYTSLLAPEEYGLYTISIALLSFLCIIFSDWVGLSGLRFFRQFQISKDLPKYISVLVSILIINILTMFILAYTFRNNFFDFFKIDPTYFYAILVLIIPVAIRALLFQLLRAQLKPIAFTLSTIINQILTICFSVFFIKICHLGAMSLLLGMGVSISIIDLLLIYQSRIFAYFEAPKLHWKILFPIFIYGIPIAATSLSTWIINQSNKFIMNNISGFTDVSYVGVAYGVTFPILMTIFSIITVAAIPRIIRMYEDKIDVKPVISKFTGYYVLVSLPIISLIALYAPDYLEMFASSKFHEAYRLVPYLAFGVFFMGLTDYTTLQYHLANKTYIDFVIKLLSGLLGIYLNIILIPKLGLEGVGIATLLGNLLYFFLSVVIVLPNLKTKAPCKILLDMCIGFIFMFFVYNFIHRIEILPTASQMSFLLIIFYMVYSFSKAFLFKNCKQ